MKICKNCSSEFNGKFCHHCGQKEFSISDKSITKIASEAFHFLTSLDNTLFRTIAIIFRKPGQLSLDYCSGKQKTYFKPISLFFLVVVAYLLFPVASGLNTELKYYKGSMMFGKTMEKDIQFELEKRSIPFEELSEKFKSKSGIIAKIVLFVFIPISVIIIFLLYFRKERLLYDNVILATEINVFYIFGLFFIIPLILFLLSTVIDKLFNLNFIFFDDDIGSIIIFSTFTLFTVLLFKRVLQENWIKTILKGVIFVVLHSIFLTSLYRYIVFKLVFTQI